jgi:predicted esterase
MKDRVKESACTFHLACPYTLVLPDGFRRNRAWPLVIALHGMGQYEALMQRAMAPLFDRPWIWLFPRGVHPFEMRTPEKIRIGYAWYLYTGEQDGLRESMKLSDQHLMNLQDVVRKEYPVSDTAVIGFSQGGYLAGYVAPHHPERFRAGGCIGGRIKHEFLDDTPGPAREQVALAQFHGGKDQNVTPALAREALEACGKSGFKDTAYFEDAEAGHEISEKLVHEVGLWLERLLT